MANNPSNAIAIFKLPNSKEIKWVHGNCNSKLKSLTQIEENAFVISPFNKGNEAYYFPFSEVNDFQNESINPYLENLIPRKELHFKNSNKEEYTNLVEKAVELLKNNPSSFQKVVLATSKSIHKNNFDPITFFETLANSYPQAFVYCAFTPESGWWIGASPETLVTSYQNQFTSIALAGTLPPNANRNFSNKEIEEQHWVEVFIEEKLKEANFEYQKNGPEPFSTGHLTHLKTSYIFGSNQNKTEVLELIKKLNPTPAVAGVPTEKAIHFIQEYEGISREFYAGFIGIKQENRLDLFVNLRCLQWQNNQITLFAGAGITKDSDPKSEWEETQHKMNTLEKFLFTIFASGSLFLSQFIS